MKNKVVICILVLGMINWTPIFNGKIMSSTIHSFNLNMQDISFKTASLNMPINITSNVHFGMQGYPGSGTVDDPYRIENLNLKITSKVLIAISNTSVHFIISGCILNGSSTVTTGISLTNVKFGQVENNTISMNQEDGITGINVSECLISNNNINFNSRFGILLVDSSDCNVYSNQIHNNQMNGIHFKNSHKIIVSENEIYNHQYGDYSPSGFFLENSSEIQIEQNSINDNYQGINFINSADNNNITNNLINNNIRYGIRLEYASRNIIHNNTISENHDYGIKITIGSSKNSVRVNDITGNNEGGRQARDDGIDNMFVGNYWADWSNIDTNEDLIADDPYPIDGITMNFDPYPLVNLSNQARKNLEKKLEAHDNFLFPILILVILGGGIGIGYVGYNSRVQKKNQRKETSDEREEPITEDLTSDLLNRLKPIYHKLIVGLEYIQAYFFPQPVTVPLLTVAKPTTLLEYFPMDFKEDLQGGMKWRTILTLIEIAYQDPSDTNPKKLATSLGLPLSTVSGEIKKLKMLNYIEAFVSAQVMRDGRYRNYTITQKGYELLYTLKETLGMAITRLKEQNEINFAVK